MLSGGVRSQTQVLRQAGEWTDVDKIAGILGPGWNGGLLGTPEEALALAKQGQIGGLLHSGGSRFHMAVIEPTPGGILVRDPLPGVTYTVDQQWIERWVVGAFWK